MSFLHSIKFRFTLWYLLVLVVLLVSLSFGVYFYMSRTLHDNLDDSIRVRAEQIVSTRGGFASLGLDEEFQRELGEVVSLFVYQDEVPTEISTGETALLDDSSPLIQSAFEGQSGFEDISSPAGDELRLFAMPVSLNPPPMRQGMMGRDSLPTEPGVLVVGRSTADIENALDNLVRILLIAVPLTMVIAGVGGIFLARRALAPVERIAQTALQIEESGHLDRRIEVDTKDELGQLASILNRMIGRLEETFNRQKEFTADASHELRTPLSVIQAESTLTLQKERSADEYQSSLETVAQEASHMSALVDQLLALARADAGKQDIIFEPVHLGQLLDEVASDAEILGREKGVRIHREAMEEQEVMGDVAKLKRLFLNLLDNAIRYTPSGRAVSLSLGHEDRMARVMIRDEGIGIPPEHIPHIFERFYRVDKARSRAEGGSGLGLAICQQIAEAHGGRIEVESIDGNGSIFTVFLPLAEQG